MIVNSKKRRICSNACKTMENHPTKLKLELKVSNCICIVSLCMNVLRIGYTFPQCLYQNNHHEMCQKNPWWWTIELILSLLLLLQSCNFNLYHQLNNTLIISLFSLRSILIYRILVMESLFLQNFLKFEPIHKSMQKTSSFGNVFGSFWLNKS